MTDLRIGKGSLEKMTARRGAILDELHGAYSGAPSTDNKAYKKAQDGLQEIEELYFSESELDALLRKELRTTGDAQSKTVQRGGGGEE